MKFALLAEGRICCALVAAPAIVSFKSRTALSLGTGVPCLAGSPPFPPETLMPSSPFLLADRLDVEESRDWFAVESKGVCLVGSEDGAVDFAALPEYSSVLFFFFYSFSVLRRAIPLFAMR